MTKQQFDNLIVEHDEALRNFAIHAGNEDAYHNAYERLLANNKDDQPYYTTIKEEMFLPYMKKIVLSQFHNERRDTTRRHYNKSIERATGKSFYTEYQCAISFSHIGTEDDSYEPIDLDWQDQFDEADARIDEEIAARHVNPPVQFIDTLTKDEVALTSCLQGSMTVEDAAKSMKIRKQTAYEILRSIRQKYNQFHGTNYKSTFRSNKRPGTNKQ